MSESADPSGSPSSPQPASDATVRVVVGRIGRAHGLRGEVGVHLRTDVPDIRFAAGESLITDDPARSVLVVAHSRWQANRFLVRFDGIDDRTAAEALRGIQLESHVLRGEAPADPEEFFDWQLTGCECVGVDGQSLGTVIEVVHLPGQDLLLVASGRQDSTSATMVPLVSQLVPTVDVVNQRIVIDPPPGLFAATDDDDTEPSQAH